MSLGESSPPPAKQSKVGSIYEIKDLSDADLGEIFKHLPPLDRLFISAVCKRWNGISRAVWADVTHLDLSPIPGRQIAPIISQCPNLQTVVAHHKKFGLDELHVLTHVNVRSLKLYSCEATIVEFGERIYDAFSLVFSSSLRSASWRELVLHNFFVSVVDLGTGKPLDRVSVPASLPAALKRLQISGRLEVTTEPYRRLSVGHGLQGLEQLQSLECLMLSVSPDQVSLGDIYRLSTAQLTGLRELHLGRKHASLQWNIFSGLTHLEALFLDSVIFQALSDFTTLVTKHPTLRILVLTGEFYSYVKVPARARYPNGAAAPVPMLHVFVGRSAADQIRFPKSSNDTLKIYPIDKPLPQLLERADIAPIFDGIWLAAEIKEAAKQRHTLFKYHYQYDVGAFIRHAERFTRDGLSIFSFIFSVYSKEFNAKY